MATPSIVSICNSGLIKIGCDLISSLDDGDKAANLCKEQYEKLRDEVMSASPWNFAKRRVQLAQVSDDPLFGFTYQYQLPLDCLFPLETDDDSFPHNIEGEYLLSDAVAVKLLYVAREEDTSKYPPKFCEALALRIAAEFAFPMTNSTTLGAVMMKAYEEMLKEARWRNSAEQTPTDLEPGDTWINARN